jgi:murein DD-endopeptidase MepM/ murein hydrolase activator NlpD
MRYHPILHISRLHSGIDFGISCGTPVYAAAAGVVVSAGAAGGYGNRVVIDHGFVRGVDLATTYNHLTSVAVRGGRVSRGQLIGHSGTTGLSTGCHLHFETLASGAFVNPMNWL